MGEPDTVLAGIVCGELREILGVTAAPERVQVQRWPRAMAQYSVGHKARMMRIQERAASLSGLQLAGNAYDGIGISDCIRLGRNGANQLVACTNLMELVLPTRPDGRAKVQSHT